MNTLLVLCVTFGHFYFHCSRHRLSRLCFVGIVYILDLSHPYLGVFWNNYMVNQTSMAALARGDVTHVAKTSVYKQLHPFWTCMLLWFAKGTMFTMADVHNFRSLCCENVKN